MNFDWRKTIQAVAPTIASALGGPLAGQAVAAIGTALLGKTDATEDEIARAVLSATPEQLLELKKEDHDFALKLKELDVDLERVNQEDRASARKRQVDAGDHTPQILAYVYSTGFFALLLFQGWMAWESKEIPGSIQRTLDTSTGVLFAMILASKDFFLGSSAGSRIKDKLVNLRTGDGQ